MTLLDELKDPLTHPTHALWGEVSEEALAHYRALGLTAVQGA